MTDRRRERWLIVASVLVVCWVVLAVWLVPWLIRDAYREESFGFLNRMIAGRRAHPVEHYLEAWSALVWKVTGGVVLIGATAWLAARVFPWLSGLERRTTIARRSGLACLLAISVLWAIVSLWFPLGWDHGIMASLGDIIVRGGLPYADGWDMKGPLPYYVFAGTQWLLGPQTWGIRVLDLMLVVGASIALGKLVGRVTTPAVAPWVALGLFLWYASLGYFFTAQPDGWVAMGVTLCFAPLVGRVRSSVAELLVCGFVVGLATLVKPLFGAFLIVPALHLWLTRSGSRLRTLVRCLSMVVVFVVPAVLAIAWFGARGALDDLISVHLRYATTYARVGSLQLGSRMAGTLEFLWGEEIAVLLPVILLGGYAVWRIDRRTAALVWTWLGTAVFAAIFQGKFFEYHWIPAYPPLIALAAIGLWALVEPSSGPRSPPTLPNVSRLLGTVAIVVGFARMAYAPSLTIGQFTPFALGRMDADQYYGQFGLRGAPYSPGDERQVARLIQSQTDETDRIVIFGTNAGIHYLSRRTGPTRFVFSLPLMRPRGATRRAYREEFLADLQRAPPTYIIVGMTIDGGSKEEALADFPEFAALLEEGYRLQTSIGHLDVYRRLT